MAADTSGVDRGDLTVAANSGGWRRKWEQAAVDGGRWQQTTAERGSLAVEGNGGMDDGSGWQCRKIINLWVVVMKRFFAWDLPMASFFAVDLPGDPAKTDH